MASGSPLPPVSEETLQKLRRTTTATLATQLFKRGLRQRFLVGVRPLNPQYASFAGEAFTVRHIPAREDLDTLESVGPGNLQWDAAEQIPPGHVMVIDSGHDVRCGAYGNMLVTRMMCRKVGAAVTDGAFRDGPRIAKMPFPAYASGMNASTRLSCFHVADLQAPIGCAGVAVYPGDVVVGDAEGVIVIPRYLADEVAADGVSQEELEAYLLMRLEAGEATMGIYPPTAETIAAYERWRADGGSRLGDRP